jgi:uncharacterized membrane protein YcaP (DUF421 family)
VFFHPIGMLTPSEVAMDVVFQSWGDLGRIVVVGIVGYCALVILLLASGKRTFSKLNAFDFVITVALGSTLATVLLSRQVSRAEGILAFAVLIGLQFVVTWTSVRSGRFRYLVRGEPRLVVRSGEFCGRPCGPSG